MAETRIPQLGMTVRTRILRLGIPRSTVGPSYKFLYTVPAHQARLQGKQIPSL